MVKKSERQKKQAIETTNFFYQKIKKMKKFFWNKIRKLEEKNLELLKVAETQNLAVKSPNPEDFSYFPPNQLAYSQYIPPRVDPDEERQTDLVRVGAGGCDSVLIEHLMTHPLFAQMLQGYFDLANTGRSSTDRSRERDSDVLPPTLPFFGQPLGLEGHAAEADPVLPSSDEEDFLSAAELAENKDFDTDIPAGRLAGFEKAGVLNSNELKILGNKATHLIEPRELSKFGDDHSISKMLLLLDEGELTLTEKLSIFVSVDSTPGTSKKYMVVNRIASFLKKKFRDLWTKRTKSKSKPRMKKE